MSNLFIYPSSYGDQGDYVYNLAQSLSVYFTIINRKNNNPALLELLISFFKADIFLLNWIENEPLRNKSYLRFLSVRFFLTVAKVFRKKIIWTYHNLEPHNTGNNHQTKRLFKALRKKSDIIIHHTNESLQLTPDKNNFYFFHPFEKPLQLEEKQDFQYDLLIWGKIQPYKGIVEFLEFLKNNKQLNNLQILIAGMVDDKSYKNRLTSLLNHNITFINQFLSYDELIEAHRLSRFVFFSYQGNSVLNSGQLVLSLQYGSNIISPNKGAFKEMGKKKFIFTYDRFNEIEAIIKNPQTINKVKREEFIKNHSWNNFAKALHNKITLL